MTSLDSLTRNSLIIHPGHGIIKWFLHYAVCIATVSWPLPEPLLQKVQFSASSFKIQYRRFFLSLSGSFLQLLLRLLGIFILLSIT